MAGGMVVAAGCGSAPAAPCSDCVLVEGLPEDARITSLAADREGRIVAALEGHSRSSIARLDPSGVLDPTFGQGGIVDLGLKYGAGGQPPALRSLDSVIVMADGSIRFGGEAGFSGAPVVLGLTAEGHDARWRIYGGDQDTGGAAISLMDQDGALVVGFGLRRFVGRGYYGIVEDLVRYTATGERDPAFPPTPTEWATAIAPDGKFVMGGARMEPTVIRILARRVTRDGEPDPSFGAGAPVVLSDVRGIPESSMGVAPSAAGGMILAGLAGVDGRPMLLVARLDAAGRLDHSFGGGRGLVTHDVIGAGVVYGVVEAADGGIVVVGTYAAALSRESHAAATRLTPDGSLDPAFGEGGVLVADIANSYFRTVVALPDGAVVAGGSILGDLDGSPYAALFARFPAR